MDTTNNNLATRIKFEVFELEDVYKIKNLELDLKKIIELAPSEGIKEKAKSLNLKIDMIEINVSQKDKSARMDNFHYRVDYYSTDKIDRKKIILGSMNYFSPVIFNNV